MGTHAWYSTGHISTFPGRLPSKPHRGSRFAPTLWFQAWRYAWGSKKEFPSLILREERPFRPGSYKAHFPLKDINHLRNFIHRNLRIIFPLGLPADRWPQPKSVRFLPRLPAWSETSKVWKSSVLAHSFLPVENGAFWIKDDGQGYDQG